MTTLTETSRLRFARGYRLQEDRVRQQWVIQAPERAYVADPHAGAILQLVDGQRQIKAIIDHLCTHFEAPRTRIAHDVLKLLSDLVAKGVLRL